MSTGKSAKSNWNSIKFRIPFLGLRKKTAKVTSNDQNSRELDEERAAVENENISENSNSPCRNSDRNVVENESNFPNNSDSKEDEEVNAREVCRENGGEEEYENEIGGQDTGDKEEKSNDENKEQNRGATKHHREEDEAAFRREESKTESNKDNIDSTTNMNDTLPSQLEEDGECQTNASTTSTKNSVQKEPRGKERNTESSEVLKKHKSFAEVGKEVRHKIITVNSFISHGSAERGENTSKRPQSVTETDDSTTVSNENSKAAQKHEKPKPFGNPQKRASITNQQIRVEKTRKDHQSKSGPEKQWRNVKTVYSVAFKHGTHESEYETAVSAKYDEQERIRQAEMLFWRLDMEDIMLRLRRINKSLDAHLRRLSEKKKPGL